MCIFYSTCWFSFHARKIQLFYLLSFCTKSWFRKSQLAKAYLANTIWSKEKEIDWTELWTTAFGPLVDIKIVWKMWTRRLGKWGKGRLGISYGFHLCGFFVRQYEYFLNDFLMSLPGFMFGHVVLCACGPIRPPAPNSSQAAAGNQFPSDSDNRRVCKIAQHT